MQECSQQAVHCYFRSVQPSWSESEESLFQKVKGARQHVVYLAETADTLCLAVDHIQSIPLFYAWVEGSCWVSDDAEWVWKQALPGVPIDKSRVQQCLMTGYVTGEQTIIPGLFQVPAGEMHVIDKKSGKVRKKAHHSFLPTADRESGGDWEELLDSVFKDFIDELAGRTAVIPLSGGYDSRLIAFMLKKHGVENVLCFSYGKPGNREAEISRQVAGYLGFDWHFVPYCHESIAELAKSPLFSEYLRYGGNLRSVAHLQDFAAVHAMHEEKRLPEDALFLPGHSLDFLAGSHLLLPEGKEISRERLCRQIYDHHYCLWKFPELNDLIPVSEDPEEECLQDLKEALIEAAIDTPEEWIAFGDWWNWRERQAKFIVNSVRVYDFFGYKWALPLWDPRLMAFWEGKSIAERRDKSLFLDFTHRQQNLLEEAIIPPRAGSLLELCLQMGIKRSWLKRAFQLCCGVGPLRRFAERSVYDGDPLCFYSYLPRETFSRYFKGRGHPHAFVGLLQWQAWRG